MDMHVENVARRRFNADREIALARSKLLQFKGQWPALVRFAYTLDSEKGLSISWINKFARGKVSNPGVRTLQTLHDAMSEFEVQ